jgi:hypothetical protein
MAETRKTGAGSHLAGVLERAPQLRDESPVDPEPSPTEASSKGRGPAPVAKLNRATAARTAKRIKGRTIYIPDDLFERIIVQAHRRDLTISDYCVLLLERHVPDHRRIGPASTAEAGDVEAA